MQADGSRSEVRALQKGIPQGTVLGPFLFLLFIDTITKSLAGMEHTKALLYADDLVVTVQAGTQKELNRRLNNVAAAVVCGPSGKEGGGGGDRGRATARSLPGVGALSPSVEEKALPEGIILGKPS